MVRPAASTIVIMLLRLRVVRFNEKDNDGDVDARILDQARSEYNSSKNCPV
jgi:hypothetical protein